MEKVIDFLSKRYKDFEIWRECRDVKSIEDGGGGVKVDSVAKMEWAVRAFHDGKIGFAYTSGEQVDLASMEQNLKFSLENSFADEYNILPEGLCENTVSCDKNIGITDDEGVANIVREMKEKASTKDLVKDIERVSASSEAKTAELYNSRCGLRSQSVVKYAAGIVLIVQKDGEEKIEWDFAIDDDIRNINVDAIIGNAYSRGVSLLNSSPANTGVYPVFFENRAACDLLEVFAQSFVGENIYKKKTMLGDGTLFSEKLNIFDDPAAAGGSVSYLFDGEGIKAEKKCLVENGAVKKMLLDCYYGKKFESKTTGNSRRFKIAAPPANGLSNVWISAGGKGAMTSALQGSGIAVGIVSLIGMHLVNPVTGELSVGFEGYMLEKGVYKKALSQVSISGNLKDIFKNVTEIGDDFAFCGQTGSPSLLVRDIVVSGV